MSDIRSAKLQDLSTRLLERGAEEGFWREVQVLADSGAYPIVEAIEEPDDTSAGYVRITFLHRASAHRPENVLLLANINHVVPEEMLFDEIGQTGVYYKSVEVPSGVRFGYRILENDPLTGLFAGAKYGTRMHLLGIDPDPLNRNKQVYSKDFAETWVELEDAAPQPYIEDRGSPSGKVTAEQQTSERLGYSRYVHTYTPPDYDPESAYPLLILFDAGTYFGMGSLQLTLENLIAEGSIPPLLVLGIDAGRKDDKDQRNDEFTCSLSFMQYLDRELLPWFTSTYNVVANPHQRIIAGSSFGGLMAMYYAFNHPETVTNVLSQSGSFHWGREQDEFQYEWLVREFAFAKKAPLRIFMEVGVLEGEYAWSHPNFPHQVISNRHFKTVLEMKGHDVAYNEYGGGHEMLSWRGGIAEGLKHFFR
jgi:enterochelin esterase family protein